ncbi:unnamed protein product [Parajaminaea phylloscopi]
MVEVQYHLVIISFKGQVSEYRLRPEQMLNDLFREYAREHSLPLRRLRFRYNYTEIGPTEQVKLRDLILYHTAVIYASLMEPSERNATELRGQELGG